MSTQTIRRCDSCGNVTPADEELWTIGVVAVLNANPQQRFTHLFNMNSRGTTNNRLLQDHFKDYCRPCMLQKGLVVAPNEEPAKKPDTLDDLLREIVAEEVAEVMDEGGR